VSFVDQLADGNAIGTRDARENAMFRMQLRDHFNTIRMAGCADGCGAFLVVFVIVMMHLKSGPLGIMGDGVFDILKSLMKTLPVFIVYLASFICQKFNYKLHLKWSEEYFVVLVPLVAFCMYSSIYSQVPLHCFHLLEAAGGKGIFHLYQHVVTITIFQVLVIHGTMMQSNYALLVGQFALTGALFMGTVVTMDKCPIQANQHNRVLMISAVQHLFAFFCAILWSLYRRSMITADFIKQYNDRMAKKKAA